MRLRGGKLTLPDKPDPINWQKAPQSSWFFDLPPEIRCMIYRYAISKHQISLSVLASKRSRRIGLECHHIWNWGDCLRDEDRHFSALLKTCKRISEECMPILYDQTQFDFGFNWYKPEPLKRKLQYYCSDLDERVPTILLSRIRHLTLTIFTETRQPGDMFRRSLASLVAKTNQGSSLRSLHFNVCDSRTQPFQTDDLSSWLEFPRFPGTCIFELPDMAISVKEVEKLKQLLKGNHGMKADVFMYGDWPDDRDGWPSSLPFPPGSYLWLLQSR